MARHPGKFLVLGVVDDGNAHFPSPLLVEYSFAVVPARMGASGHENKEKEGVSIGHTALRQVKGKRWK
jgi:hypothetical protein